MKVNAQVITLYLIQLWYNIFDINTGCWLHLLTSFNAMSMSLN